MDVTWPRRCSALKLRCLAERPALYVYWPLLAHHASSAPADAGADAGAAAVASAPQVLLIRSSLGAADEAAWTLSDDDNL